MRIRCRIPHRTEKQDFRFHASFRNVIFTIFILTRLSQNRIISL